MAAGPGPTAGPGPGRGRAAAAASHERGGAGPARPWARPGARGRVDKKKEVWVYSRTDKALYTKEVAPALCF